MRTSSEAGRRKASKSPAVLQQEAADAPALAADYHGPREALQRRPSRKVRCEIALGTSNLNEGLASQLHGSQDFASLRDVAK